jgi:hypothetical protein
MGLSAQKYGVSVNFSQEMGSSNYLAITIRSTNKITLKLEQGQFTE